MSEKEEEMLTTAQVKKELGISNQTLYNWINRKLLHPVKKNPFLVKSPLLFPRSEIEAIKVKNSQQENN